ncbi:MAG: hypothetical protein RI973_1062 [Bacteroidota bacterium]|jgi:hypothetical protein
MGEGFYRPPGGLTLHPCLKLLFQNFAFLIKDDYICPIFSGKGAFFALKAASPRCCFKGPGWLFRWCRAPLERGFSQSPGAILIFFAGAFSGKVARRAFGLPCDPKIPTPPRGLAKPNRGGEGIFRWAERSPAHYPEITLIKLAFFYIFNKHILECSVHNTGILQHIFSKK